MPQLINHLNRLDATRAYDEVELARLQRAYDRARQALGIDLADSRRERLALLIFQVAETTGDSEEIFRRAVTLFQASE